MEATEYYDYTWVCNSCGEVHHSELSNCARCNFDHLSKVGHELTAAEYCKKQGRHLYSLGGDYFRAGFELDRSRVLVCKGCHSDMGGFGVKLGSGGDHYLYTSVCLSDIA